MAQVPRPLPAHRSLRLNWPMRRSRSSRTVPDRLIADRYEVAAAVDLPFGGAVDGWDRWLEVPVRVVLAHRDRPAVVKAWGRQLASVSHPAVAPAHDAGV